MKDGFKYLTKGEEDVKWGIYLNVAGKSAVGQGIGYPSKIHPPGYYFNWDSGRILQEIQINYITGGSGVLETDFGKFPVREGSVFIIYPGEWHRYRPNSKTGWVENYIGFDGVIARQLVDSVFFDHSQPIFQMGVNEEILEIYFDIYTLVENELPGFQQIASGLIVKLLGLMVAGEKQKDFSGKKIARIIEETRFFIRQNVEQAIDFEELAKSKNVGYSYFRKMFRKFTGVAPGQYQLQLRFKMAKDLLVSSDKSIKEIAYGLGFQSIYHFSSYFRQKEGVTPTQFRNLKTKNL